MRRTCAAVCSFILLFLLTVPLGACVSSETTEGQLNPSSSNNKLVIVASIFAPYDFARTIVGDAAEVSMLVPPGVETHSFEPSPEDILLLNTADVLIYVGGESDTWLDKIISSLDNPDLTLIKLTDLVATLDEVELEGMDTSSDVHEESDSEEHEEEIDEHVWTSLRNAQTIVASFANTFSELDSTNASAYQTQAQSLIEELEALDKRITDIVSTAERTTLVFGDRFPFRYFAEDYDLTCYAAFPGCSTAVDTNPKTITFLIDKVREENLPVVLYLELSDQRIAETISEETGAECIRFHSAHNISRDDLEAGISYLSIMQTNADNLEKALN